MPPKRIEALAPVREDDDVQMGPELGPGQCADDMKIAHVLTIRQLVGHTQDARQNPLKLRTHRETNHAAT